MPTEQQKKISNRLIRLKSFQGNNLKSWAAAFVKDAKARDLSPASVLFYQERLTVFLAFCDSQAVSEVTQITPELVRDYLLMLETKGRKPGGRHSDYRALRAFLFWWERETEPDNWKNPLRKVKPPKLNTDPIPGIPIDDVKAMLATCGADFFGIRDKAILLCLLDTGARASEFMGLTLADVDPTGGGVTIRKGKGRKSRIVFLGKTARKALRAYLKQRDDDSPALWVTIDGEPLAVGSLRLMLERRAKAAGLPYFPSPHDFRRAFALNMLRNGCDLISLARLMGHSDLVVLQRYLALLTDDLQSSHAKGSPADRLL